MPVYKYIRQEQYADVLTFLNDWHDAGRAGQVEEEKGHLTSTLRHK